MMWLQINDVAADQMARINHGRPESDQILRAWKYANQNRDFSFSTCRALGIAEYP